MNTPLGQHSLIDYHACEPAKLKDTAQIRTALLDAVATAGGTIVTDAFHTFSPHGVSGVVVIAESHVTIHTWPEHGYAAVDVFSCGVSLDHALIARRIEIALGARRVERRVLPRGIAAGAAA
jgi:S-adenosylmethionine decarboxylase